MPAMSPSLSGMRSVAYTTMEENAEAMTSPDMNAMTTVSHRLSTNGNTKGKGAAPRMENHITYFLPKRSPNMPPATVPMANAARKAKRQSCEVCTLTWNLSMRKNVK